MGHLKMPTPLRSALQTVDEYFSRDCFVQYVFDLVADDMRKRCLGDFTRKLDTLPIPER
jgi:hypothetical protein